MTWVKVCGITSAEALSVAEDAGADAVGFVIAPASPRYVDLETVTAMARLASVPTFIVSVDITESEALEVLKRTGVAGIQPHGLHGYAVVEAAQAGGWKALLPVPVGEAGPTIPLEAIGPHVMPLYDTAAGQRHGGTGQSFDWNLLGDVDRHFVLAGGLGPDNVRDAIMAVRPFGVDASSRLEVAPGVKDPDSIRAFIKEAKSV